MTLYWTLKIITLYGAASIVRDVAHVTTRKRGVWLFALMSGAAMAAATVFDIYVVQRP